MKNTGYYYKVTSRETQDFYNKGDQIAYTCNFALWFESPPKPCSLKTIVKSTKHKDAYLEWYKSKMEGRSLYIELIEIKVDEQYKEYTGRSRNYTPCLIFTINNRLHYKLYTRDGFTFHSYDPQFVRRQEYENIKPLLDEYAEWYNAGNTFHYGNQVKVGYR